MKLLRTIVSVPFFILFFKILTDYLPMLPAYGVFAIVTIVYYIYVEKYRIAEAIIITAACFLLGLYLPVSIGKFTLPF
jgi:hypothetical protein